MMQNRPEILAPVGSEEALIAAVRSGADAVYFGTGECNARRNAGKFEGEALNEAVRYCHARNVAVYLTVNTLLRDEELQDAAHTLERIADSGADGIILQDLAVNELAKTICPSLERHASTQMAVHNVSGVLQLEDMGFSRVVLARELSGREIRMIRERTHAELEVFVHGALCMSASGMCYLSASLGERSGNRGTCAQPCRLPFACNGAQNCLSLKDMSHLSYLRELAEIGVASCKIEGRMKRPEYVAAAVHAARCARDGEPYEMDSLKAVFSRSGFTDGYYTGKRNHSMFGVRTREDAEQSKSVLSSFRNYYRIERLSVPFDASMEVALDRPVSLQVTDGEHTAAVSGAVPQTAQTVAATKPYLERSIAKTGGTPFQLRSFTCKMDPGLTVPSSELNALRRHALDALLRERERAPKRECFPAPAVPTGKARRPRQAKLFVRFADAEQFFLDESIETCSLPVNVLSEHPEWISENVFCELPDLCYPEEEGKLLNTLSALRAKGVSDAVAGNIGMIRLAREAGMRVHGGYGLNVTNQMAENAYRALGVTDQTLSFELPFAKMREFPDEASLGCILAGRLPLMQFRSCPARTEKGCGSCNGHPAITDRTGRTFPIVCHARTYSTMLNSILYDAADKRLPDLDFYTVYLTIESKKEAKDLIASVVQRAKPACERTTGMSFRTLL
ncbi:MAG: U32 family peptidase [Clostridia bacterium]|nr:U32 family peptidase [Clostridia bacterium]